MAQQNAVYSFGNNEQGVLILSDGTSYIGNSFGAKKSIAGETVFQTGMVGYPESLTDPSYRGQILILTFPLIGNYGVPDREAVVDYLEKLPKYFESSEIHVAALIVGFYAEDYSHYLAKSSLSEWLVENGIPALHGMDTRALTKKIREGGTQLGKVLFPTDKEYAPVPNPKGLPCPDWVKNYQDVEWFDPNSVNLVAQVSTKAKKTFQPLADVPKVCGPDGKVLHIMAVDVGMKNNQVRCFVKRGVSVTVVPWDYDFIKDQNYDGLFISNGPGDPSVLKPVIEKLKTILEMKTKPVFGICLGHQLMALAAGAKTEKLLFGNRGHNIPCIDAKTKRCYITSQNHGFAVNVDTLPQGWEPYFTNANDHSNEGICHKTLPYFSVQFHPESTPGPWDTEFLFDKFITTVKDCKNVGKLVPLADVIAPPAPVRHRPRKVLVLGSGGLSIGQAGEFDYSGSQAIKALKEEGIYTVLINPNIATIQTSKGLADKVYFLPVNPDYVRKVIKYEKPDGIYVTFGGQTALNVGVQLKDEFAGLGVTVLGTQIETIQITEDRDLFAKALGEIGEKMAVSSSAATTEEAVAAANEIGYPLIIRAAYALGGLGSGFANNEEEVRKLCHKAFAISPQVLVERSMKGWKEVEYEVVRDAADNCITVCNMENFDPLGIHTGDSIVVAPSQTLDDEDYMMLRRTAVNVIRHLGVIGECNIQYALNPYSKEYCIIEVNARLSRSSALASKATGYPLAFVAAKLGLGIPLTEIKNNVTKKTIACFEPSLDYCVVKIPRWDLKKFNRVSTKISSAMKSVGEVMAIGRNFEETIQKAIRAVEYSFSGFADNDFVDNIDEELAFPSDQRLLTIAKAFHAGYTVEKVHSLTNIDRWFLNRLMNIVNHDKRLAKFTPKTVPESHIRYAKQIGFSDKQIANTLKSTELALRKIRKDFGITPFVKQIDTVAAEFPAFTNYLYTTYNACEHDVKFEDKGIMVLGSGVYRIGSSVEFDWCAVRCIRTLRASGHKTVMVNYNPETVSTDYDEADRLYFENLTLERVLDIYELETSSGVIVCMGGQSPNNIALSLHRENVKILGTSPELIDSAENRYKFSRMCDKIGVDQPQWKELTTMADAYAFSESVGFPVLVRPSYVLSGAAMNVVYSKTDLEVLLEKAVKMSSDYPVVITKFIEEAKEIEMDAVANEGKLVMHVISEHVENAGVHSGDATLVLPPQDLDPETVRKIEIATAKVVDALNVTGPCNIQFIAKNNEIKIIECNVRASRSFPFCSKVLQCDLIEMATKVMMGESFEPYPELPMIDYVAVKVPQFSFGRLAGADPILGVEMASTGEVACFGKDKYEAYMKALVATGFKLPKKNILLSIGSYKEKVELLPSVKKLHELGYKLFATAGTSDFMSEHDIPLQYLDSIDGGEDQDQRSEYSLDQHLGNNMIDLYINLPSKNNFRRPASYMSRGYLTRRMAVDLNIPLITNIKCAKLFVEALSRGTSYEIASHDYFSSHNSFVVPSFVNIEKASKNSMKMEDVSKKAIAAGFTVLINSADKISASGSYADYSMAQAAPKDSQFLDLSSAMDSVKVGEAFKNGNKASPLIIQSSSQNLSSVLLLSNLHGQSIHITGMYKKQDVELVVMAKEAGLKVTFDVSAFNLFFTKADFDLATMGTEADVAYLWDNIDLIDAFSVDRDFQTIVPDVNVYEFALSLLLTAVSAGKLTMPVLTLKLSKNPRKIFGLEAEKESYVEIEASRRFSLPESINLQSVQKENLVGHIQRVVLRGELLYLEGSYVGKAVGRLVKSSSAGNVRLAAPLLVTNPRSPVINPMSPRPASRQRNFSLENDDDSMATLSSKYITHLPKSVEGTKDSQFYKQNIISVSNFGRKDLHTLFGVAQEMRSLVEKRGQVNLLNGKVMCSVFWEPSTRTSTSFETAMLRLGGEVVSLNQITSSIAKGETLADTVRAVGSYSDVIVLRHPEKGSSAAAAKFSPVPLINAGDGSGEHPTQALLDIFTIREELGTCSGLTVTIVGDLKHGRTVHSLVKLLALYGVKLNYICPPSLSMPDEIKAELKKAGCSQFETTDLDQVIPTTDVLYVTRVQKERFEDLSEYESVKDKFIITPQTLLRAKEHMIVLHPLPRLNEIHTEVDFDPRAAYFRQMKYGLYVRMALLALVLGRTQ